jgi:hypothetical protein
MNARETNLLKALPGQFVKVHFPDSKEFYLIKEFNPSVNSSTSGIDFFTMRGMNITEFVEFNLNLTSIDQNLLSRFDSFVERQTELRLKVHKDILWEFLFEY